MRIITYSTKINRENNLTELVKETQDGEKAVSLLVDILNREEKEKNLLKSLLDF